MGTASAQGYLVSDMIDIGGTDIVFASPNYAHVAGLVDSYSVPGIDSGMIANAGYGLRYVAKVDMTARRTDWVAVVGSPTKSPGGGLQGGFAEDEARGLAVRADGTAYLVAYDGSKDYPLAGGRYEFATTRHVFRVSPVGQVTKHSPALDPAIRRVGAIAVDPAGNIYLTGSAGGGLLTSANAPFPTGSVAPGCIAPFAMKLDASGQTTLYSTYLGLAGTQGERCGDGSPSGVFEPTGFAIAVDASGSAVVGGQAEPGVRATSGSPDLGAKTLTTYVPAVKAFASHAFVARINAAGSAITFTARLGGSERDRITAVALDSAGAIYLGGKTASSDFPTTSYFGTQFPYSSLSCPGFPSAPEMGFVAKLSADGRQILYSGFMPTTGDQLANCGGNPAARFAPLRIALDGTGRLYATGPTNSTRDYVAPWNAIPTLNGSALLYVIAADGRSLEYFTRYASPWPLGAAVDSFGHFWVAGTSLVRITAGTTPIEFTHATPMCATGATLSVRVAGANDVGMVEFFVDGSSVGSSAVAGSSAAKTVAMSPGARRVHAIYRGSSYFDGYASEVRHVPVNQAGACQ